MYSKLIFFLYLFKKKGKFKYLFYIYRQIIIIKINSLSFFKDIIFSSLHFFNYDLSISPKYLNFCKNKILHLVEVDDSNFNVEKFNFFKNKSYDIFNKLSLGESLNEKIFMDIIEINYNVTDYVSWIKNKKIFLDWLLINQKKVPNEMNNIRFISSFDLFNTIGLIYTIDGFIKSILLGFNPQFRLLCLVHKKVRGKPINQFIVDKFSKYIEFIYDDTLIKKYKPYESILDSYHGQFAKLQNHYSLNGQSGSIKINQIWNEKKFKPLFKLTNNEIDMCWKNLSKFGISKDDWFVGIHVRDPSFKGIEEHRDVDIKDYFKSFDNITKLGGWVIRLGDSKVSPLPKLDKVFDYPLSEIRSDMMDIFICDRSRFLIGTSSGMAAVSSIFNTPIAMTNYQPLSTLFLSEIDLFLPRLLKSKINNEMLSFDQLFKLPNSMGITDGAYENLFKVDVITNTENEISELIDEMIDFTSYDYIVDNVRSAYQKKIDLLIKNNNILFYPDLNFKAKMGKKFLEQYKNLF